MSNKFFLKLITYVEAIVSSRTFLMISVVWFLLQALYLAFSTKIGIPPDEAYHIWLIELYSQNNGSPFITDQSSYYHLGDVTREPSYLYHYLLGLPYSIGLFSSKFRYFYLVLRLVNILFALGSVLTFIKICEKLNVSKLTRNLSVFAITNTLMFTFISSSINYDNLLILLTLVSIYIFISLTKEFTLVKLISLACVVIAASLVKYAYLPIGLVIIIFLLVHYFRNFKKLNILIKKQVNDDRILLFFVSTLAIVLLGLFVERYGYNMVRYGEITPRCDKIHAIERCRESELFKRNESLYNSSSPDLMPKTDFSFRWGGGMAKRIFGIMAHKSLSATDAVMAKITVVLIVITGAIVRKLKLRDKEMVFMITIFLLYMTILLIANYRFYAHHGLFGVALQGRYIFPVLPLFYLVGFHYATKSAGMVKIIFASFIIATFFMASLPAYVCETNPSWHTSKTKNINQRLKSICQ